MIFEHEVVSVPAVMILFIRVMSWPMPWLCPQLYNSENGFLFMMSVANCSGVKSFWRFTYFSIRIFTKAVFTSTAPE